MAHRISPRAFETFTVTGTGTITTTGAVGGGYRTLAAAPGMSVNTDTMDVVLWKENFSEWEEVRLTRASATTFTRGTPYASSNSDAAVSFTAGTGFVWGDTPARFKEMLNTIEISVTSAATCDILGTQGSRNLITGATGPITSLGTGTHKIKFVRFDSTPILTHHATTLILPGAANIQVAAGDTAIFVSDASSNVRCVNYTRAAANSIAHLTAAGAAAALLTVGGVLKSKIINITRDMTAATGPVAYTGVGFTPTSMIIFADISLTQSLYIGLVDSTGTISGLAVAGTFATGLSLRADILIIEDTGVTKYQQGVISSFDSDGFTIAWTKGGTPAAGTAALKILCFR